MYGTIRAVSDVDTVRESLRRVFGHDPFRKGQEEVIHRLLAGMNVLAVFPTGAGKSLCYQLPALLLDGLTLVISPLIALMKDQLDALTQRGVAAARFDSTLDREEETVVIRALRSQSLKILYISPGRLDADSATRNCMSFENSCPKATLRYPAHVKRRDFYAG